eukprot:7175608-Pyramimonas_sp.AAC.1
MSMERIRHHSGQWQGPAMFRHDTKTTSRPCSPRQRPKRASRSQAERPAIRLRAALAPAATH